MSIQLPSEIALPVPDRTILSQVKISELHKLSNPPPNVSRAPYRQNMSCKDRVSSTIDYNQLAILIALLILKEITYLHCYSIVSLFVEMLS